MKMRTLARFLVVVPLAFAFLMLPCSACQRAYSWAFRELCWLGFWIGTPGYKVELRLNPHARMTGHDTQIVVQPSEGAGEWWAVTLDSRFCSYLPTAIFIALLLGTPLPWVRWRLAFLKGFLLVQAYAFSRAVLIVLVGATSHSRQSPTNQSFLTTDWWEVALNKMAYFAHLEPAVYTTAPVLVWGFVCARAGGWDSLLRAFSESGPPDTQVAARRGPDRDCTTS